MKMIFDYYIFLDYSESLIGYIIIEKDKIGGLLPKISRFKHYRSAKNRKLYLKNVNNTIKKEGIISYFSKIKIKKIRENMEIYVDILEFLKKHSNCIIFISVDNREYNNFKKFVKIIDRDKTKIVKESGLKKGSSEYMLSLVLDNLLNIRRRQNE